MDIQTISIVIAAAGVFIAAMNSVYSSREAKEQRRVELKNQDLTLQAQQQALETRQAELFMQLYNRWNTKEFAQIYGTLRYQHKRYEDFQQLWERYGDYNSNLKDVDHYSDYQTLATFFEGIGVLVRRGLIDIELVEDLFSQRIIWWWEMWQPISQDAREATGDPTLHDHALYLYNEIKRRQATIST